MTSLPSYGKVQETQPWNASVYFCSRPLHACHDSSLSYKSLDIGPSSTLSLRHFNSTLVRHCEVELIPKSGVCTVCISLTIPNPKLWIPTVSCKSLCHQGLSLASRARSPCVSALWCQTRWESSSPHRSVSKSQPKGCP